MLSVFGDESADETKRRVFAVVGVIGAEETWEQLEANWIVRTGGIPFHAKDCDSDYGDYASTRHAENKALYRDLAIILAESGLGGWGFAIDLIAQERVFPDAPGIAYYRGFIEVVDAMRKCATNNQEVVKFTFDRKHESEHNAGELYGRFREMPEWQSYTFPEIAFACSHEQPRLQAADLFAREAMKALDNQIGPVKRDPRKSWLALYNTGHFHIDITSDAWFESLKQQMPLLEETTGMSKSRYVQWLQTYGLQHNTTNLFRYVDWSQRVKNKLRS